MFVECYKNHGIETLRLVEGKSGTSKNGKRTVTKRVILTLGPLHRFDDGKPDYVKRLKQSFVDGNPLIDALLPYCSTENVRKQYKFTFNAGDPHCFGETKIYSHCLIDRILEELGVNAAINSYKSFSKIKYDVLGLFRLLVYGRILNPASKAATFAQNDDYYDPIVCSDYMYNIYDTLDFIHDHKKQIITRLNTKLMQQTGRRNSVIYYDVTNFYFETDRPDEEIENEDGTISKGIRQNGVSKEERKLPIVQMGLFMDENGIPISIEIFPGNTLDHLTVDTALSKNIDDVINSRFLFVADRGICNYITICHLLDRSKGYIMSKSILKSKDEEKKWILDPNGYTVTSEAFRYKSRVVRKTVKDSKGKKRTITEKVVVYWSKKFYDKQMHENKKFIDILKKIKENPNGFRVSASRVKELKKYFKKELVNIETGEAVDSTKLRPLLDDNVVDEFCKYFGYYQIVTSELEMSDTEVIDKYHQLTEIENQFRIMKGSLEGRPLWVRDEEHIEAHLLICLIALIVIRIIQTKIVEYKDEKDKEKRWEMGLNDERIVEALRKWTVADMDGNLFRMHNINNPDLQTILNAFHIEIPPKFFTRLELKSLKKSMKIFS
ncbi:IS1634 family transposase [Ruminococcus sp.]|uniref:IS1634 family transposase n=1 Tax=Ruminococcus sp. TaxID=41978 RepID=UPI002600FAEF|nr:IS1634 family transposase [Ruminococcus sp.]